jgi:hypothetical protein
MFTTLLVGQRPKQKAKKPDSGYLPFSCMTQYEARRRNDKDAEPWTDAMFDVDDAAANWKTL